MNVKKELGKLTINKIIFFSAMLATLLPHERPKKRLYCLDNAYGYDEHIEIILN